MNFVDTCIADSLPIWEECLHTDFLTGMVDGTLEEACFRDYIVDDSLYLRQYAKVFAWGIIGTEDPEAMRTFYSFLSFVNEGEGSTRLQYLKQFGLRDEEVQKLPQRPENKRYTDYMLEASREGAPECMMASLPCTLSYGWIFAKLLRQHPELRDTIYWPMVQDYTENGYDAICERWIAFGNQICEGLPQKRLERCLEIFRECSRLELDFWKMSGKPRTDDLLAAR